MILARDLRFASVVVLLLAACSSSDGDASATPGGSTTEDGGVPPVTGATDGALAVSVGEESPSVFVQGKSRALPVKITRAADVAGPVTVTASGLPGGITALPGTIAAGATDGSVVVEVAATAAQAPFGFTLEAVASDGTTAKVEVSAVVRGRPGSFDTAFGTDGIQDDVFGAFDGIAWDVAVQPDGKLVVSGQSATNTITLHRLLPNGARDAGFGTEGMVDFGGGQGPSRVVSLGTGADASLLTFYRGSSEGKLFRTNADGAPVTTFGVDGVANLAIPAQGFVSPRDVAVLPDGRALVVARYPSAPGGAGAGISRFLASGALDDNYSAAGLCWFAKPLVSDASFVFADAAGAAVAVVNLDDGRLALTGCTSIGTKDTSLGSDPSFVAPFTVAAETALSVVRKASGSFIVLLSAGGWIEVDATGKIVRGPIALSPGASPAQVLVTPDGRVIVASTVGPNVRLERFTADGLVDAEFGAAGSFVYPIAVDNDASVARLVLQPDGKLLVLGKSYGTLRNVIARVWD